MAVVARSEGHKETCVVPATAEAGGGWGRIG